MLAEARRACAPMLGPGRAWPHVGAGGVSLASFDRGKTALLMIFQPTLASITRKNFEHQKSTPKLQGFRVSGPGRHSSDTVSTLLRHSFDTFFPGARNYFWDVAVKYDGSNVTLCSLRPPCGRAPWRLFLEAAGPFFSTGST
eukprot:4999600-Pyramimonas_sp.AAC.1